MIICERDDKQSITHSNRGGKGLIKAVVGAVIGKKRVAEIKKNLQPNKPKTPTPVKKA